MVAEVEGLGPLLVLATLEVGGKTVSTLVHELLVHGEAQELRSRRQTSVPQKRILKTSWWRRKKRLTRRRCFFFFLNRLIEQRGSQDSIQIDVQVRLMDLKVLCS